MYEETECFNTVPSGATEDDPLVFMGNKLQAVREDINLLFLGEDELSDRLLNIVDETEHFVRSYEVPGVVKRWRAINPTILFFDCSFELMENTPELYKAISWGLTEVKLACYPDESLKAARNRYMKAMRKKIEDSNLCYSEERIFQEELLHTLTLVFKHDFKDYL